MSNPFDGQLLKCYQIRMLLKHLQDIESFVRQNDTISLHDILNVVGRDSLLILLVLLSIFNIVLSPLPANSFVLGVPLLLLSSLYWVNAHLDKIDWKIFYKKFSCAAWRPYLEKSHGVVEKIEKWTDPRWEKAFLIENRMNTGFSLVFMNLVVLLPIPFMNIPGSIATICLAIGIMEKDGIMLSMGYAFVFLHVAAVFLLHQSF